MTTRATLIAVVLWLASCGESSLLTVSDEQARPLFGHLQQGSRVTVEGRLQVLGIDDLERGTLTRQLVVEDRATGTRLGLLTHPGASWSSAALTGAEVRVSGSVAASALSLDSPGDLALLAAPPAIAGATRSVLVYRVDFSDSAVSCSAADIDARVLGGSLDVAGWYREHSYGAMSFSGRTVSVKVAASVASEGCDYQGWAVAADAAARAQGVEPGEYTHHVYVLPDALRCGASVATLGCGASCSVWVSRCEGSEVYAHALGHNLGWEHAGTDGNNDGAAESELGDRTDLMGSSGVGYRHASAPRKLSEGWVPVHKVVRSTAGTVRLAPLERSPLATAEAQVLVLPKADEPGWSYAVSYRRREGEYSGGLAGDEVSIHRMLAGASPTLQVATLSDGVSWSDPLNGLTITQLSRDGDAATVSVETTCLPNAPAVALRGSPASAAAGTGSFTVTLSNRDAPGCVARSFTLETAAPGGLGAALAQRSLVLAPGESASAELVITVPAGTAGGAYAVSVSAADPADPQHGATASALYLVDGAPTEPVSTLGASARGATVTLSWAIPSDGSGSGAASYRVLRDGELVGTTGATTFVEELVPNGTWAYGVVAVDAAGNAAAAGLPVVINVSRRSAAQ